ncbi:MAG TPA: oligopeptide:H+ symporter [Rhabdochlamydiaceae bacterium]|nr:oligopeptide:H+ symporter [Rhabdochlamydiaceae bacterium]
MLITLFKQPKAVFLLAFVQLWNRFSHYGMRALLLLYMVKILKMPDPLAIGTFAVYCALVELGGVFVAYLADKFLGLRRAVMLGGWLIGIGHLLLALELDFCTALGFVILGSSLYTTNIATFLGEFYPQGDPRREQGFTIFYMSINVGAFLATLLCGYIAENFGWHLGFGLAAIGMVIANLTLWSLRSSLQDKGESPAVPLRKTVLIFLLMIGLGTSIYALQRQNIASPFLPWVAGGALIFILSGLFMKKQMGRQVIMSLIISMGGLILFFTAEEQIGTSLLLFADRMGSSKISAISLLAINPLVIILGGTFAHALLCKLRSPSIRLLVPFVLIAGAFGCMAWGTSLFAMGTFPLLLSGSVIGLISFAELLIGPATYSHCSEVTSTYRDPKVMALMPIGFSMAASLGGVYSQALAGASTFDPHRYGIGFGILALGLMILGGLLAYTQRQISKSVSTNSKPDIERA